MREDLELLRKLRGLGLDRPSITVDENDISGVIRIHVEGVHKKSILQKPEVICLDRTIPSRELDHPNFPPHELRKNEYEEIYVQIRDALTQTYAKRTKGDVLLHGYCQHCGKTAIYTIPAHPAEEKKEKPEKKG